MDLRRLTTTVGEALEAEDRRIATACGVRGQIGGLLSSPLEQYYQSIAWRAVLPYHHAKMEEKKRDLTIYDPTHNRAHIEMKTWLSAGGLQEMRGILDDIEKLQRSDVPDAAFMLFSANYRGAMAEQLEWLRNHVSAGPWGAIWQGPHTYCFPILSIWEPNTAFEFWVAAWPVKVGPMFGPAFAQAA